MAIQKTQAPWAIVSVGSNMGDPRANCQKGIDSLCQNQGIGLMACSKFYETQPVDYTDQNWFVNAAIMICTELTPKELFECIQHVQRTMGRKAGGIRFGPRALDLDIIFYQDIVMETPWLTIPHPRMHKRRFVLQPICDIDPTVVHPVFGLDVKTILNQLVVEDQDIRQC
ncbi:MAG: 2-amino-4-hydroxy-6-hydroxymethyldihydropteridine diphosphokinase [Desulfobacteraceae bacterium]|nr:2-amino-4-hydroxy-6-hydroxymethyldihydropteridine diphosphokinase [Desulfobacteraceae bacterium]